MPRISVAIVAYRNDATLPQTLAALSAQTCRDFEVVVVNNGLTPFLDTYSPPPGLALRIVDPKANLGFAAGNNLAAAQAAPDTQWLVALNPDAYPATDWLANFIIAADKYPAVTMFGSLQIEATRPDICDGMGDCYHIFGLGWRHNHGQPLPALRRDEEVFSACGAAAFYRLDRFRAVGGFDEDYFCYFEDVDLGFRLRLQGDRCIQLADVAVRHVGGSSGTSAFAVTYGLRNLIWTFLKNMPLPWLALFLPGFLAVVLALLLRHAAAGQGRAAVTALRQAVSGLPRCLQKRRIQRQNRTATGWAVIQAMTWLPLEPLRHLLRRNRRAYFSS